MKKNKKMPVTEKFTQFPSLISRPSLPTAGLVLLRISKKNIANRFVNTREGTSSTKMRSKAIFSRVSLKTGDKNPW